MIEKALRQAELVIVQDAYHPTATSRLAHVILPAAQWSEKEGVMTNSERRVTYMPKLVEPPGEALPDWQIIARFADALGFGADFAYASSARNLCRVRGAYRKYFLRLFGHELPQLKARPLAVALSETSRWTSYACTQTGIFPTSDGRAHFIAVEHAEPVEAPDADYPLVLTTGRSKYHWHTMTRTGKNAALRKSAPDPILEINRADARRYGIHDADFVEVISRRGKVVAQCRVTEEIVGGHVFLAVSLGPRRGFLQSGQ